MEAQPIHPGDHLRARTATNDWISLRAVTGIEPGEDFQIVWVCKEVDWAAAQKADPTKRLPWPADEVQLMNGGGQS